MQKPASSHISRCQINEASAPHFKVYNWNARKSDVQDVECEKMVLVIKIPVSFNNCGRCIGGLPLTFPDSNPLGFFACRQSLDELAGMAADKLEPVQNQGYARPSFSGEAAQPCTWTFQCNVFRHGLLL